MTWNKTPDDLGETPGLFEPLHLAEESPLRCGVLQSLDRVLTASAALQACVADAAAARSRAAKAEHVASWMIEGLRSDAVSLACAEKAQDCLSSGSFLDPEHLTAAHGYLLAGDHDANPGQLRSAFVQVGRHVPPSPGAVPRLLRYMQVSYNRPGRIGALLGIAASHHRLAWLHPFLDGNGRIIRLVSRARMIELIPGAALWSLSEGMMADPEAYMGALARADEPRRGDRDGRGTLSEARLAGFSEEFFLACLRGISSAAQAAGCQLPQ